jgi:hypothetical protein
LTFKGADGAVATAFQAVNYCLIAQAGTELLEVFRDQDSLEKQLAKRQELDALSLEDQQSGRQRRRVCVFVDGSDHSHEALVFAAKDVLVNDDEVGLPQLQGGAVSCRWVYELLTACTAPGARTAAGLGSFSL